MCVGPPFFLSYFSKNNFPVISSSALISQCHKYLIKRNYLSLHLTFLYISAWLSKYSLYFGILSSILVPDSQSIIGTKKKTSEGSEKQSLLYSQMLETGDIHDR